MIPSHPADPEVLALLREIHTTPFPRLPKEEAALRLHLWSLRWRVYAESRGEVAAGRDPTLRAVRGLVLEALRLRPDAAPHLRALDWRCSGDWADSLQEIERDLDRRRRIREDRDQAARKALERFDELRAVPSRYALPEDPEGVRLLVEGVRALAPALALREDLADFAWPWRNLLLPEFAFLWPRLDLAKAPAHRTHLRRREILARMLHRTIAKSAIGAAHAPREMLSKGFPKHQVAEARDALALLVREGILFQKSTCYGWRVSIRPDWLPAAGRFIEGGPLGNPAVDHWVSADTGKESVA